MIERAGGWKEAGKYVNREKTIISMELGEEGVEEVGWEGKKVGGRAGIRLG